MAIYFAYTFYYGNLLAPKKRQNKINYIIKKQFGSEACLEKEVTRFKCGFYKPHVSYSRPLRDEQQQNTLYMLKLTLLRTPYTQYHQLISISNVCMYGVLERIIPL